MIINLIISVAPILVLGLLLAMLLLAVFFLIDAPRDLTFYILIAMITLTFTGYSIVIYLIESHKVDVLRDPFLYAQMPPLIVAAWFFSFGSWLQGFFLRSFRRKISLVEGIAFIAPYFFLATTLNLITVTGEFYLRYFLSGIISLIISTNIAYESRLLIKIESSHLLRFIYYFAVLTGTYSLFRSILIGLDYLFFIHHYPSIVDINQFWVLNRTLMFLVIVFSQTLLLLFWIQSRSRMAHDRRVNSKQIYDLLIEKESLLSRMTKNKTLIEAGAFSAGMAHELNQFLARIQINAERILLLANARGFSEEFEPLINKIKTANVSAANLILQMKYLFKSSELDFTLCDTKELVLEAVECVKDRSERSDITFHFALNAHELVELWRPLLVQVLVNLLTNAIESLEESRDHARMIRIETSTVEGMLTIAISDNGKGVAIEGKNNIFSLFTTSKADGMGIGLWFCSYVVEKHHGHIEYENLPLSGACFKLSIPVIHSLIEDLAS
jgi:signal transduction histidine kinase